MNRLLITATALTLALTIDAAPVTQPNCLVNGDFEAAINPDGTAVGWTKLPKNFKIVKNAGENGSTGLVYENDDPDFYAFPAQRVKLEPGLTYEISARVFIERLSSPKGCNRGPELILEGYDEKGKYVAIFSSGCTTKKGQWVDLKKRGKIPENAKTITFSPFVARDMIGKVQFDSFRVERVVLQPVYGVHSSAYRAEVAEGKVDFYAGLEFKGANLKREDFSPVFFVPKADGGERMVKPSVFDDEKAKITIAVNKLPMGKSKIRFELRRKGENAAIEHGTAETVITRLEKLPSRKVWIDRSNRLIVDGKPFFPLGMYWSEHVSTTNKDVELFAKGPFNCVMNYDGRSEEELNAFHRHGIKVFYSLSNAFADGKSFATVEQSEKWVADKVRRFKDHPALLAWYVNDERGLDFMPQLLARQKYLHEADPDHPTWSVMYQLGILKHYVDTCDVIGTDPYPIGGSGKLEMVGEWTDAARNSNFGARPIWMVPQAFDWGLCWKNQNDRTRYPELAELKNMFWTSIVSGANGIIAYNFTHLRQMEWKTPRAKTWPATAEAGREIKRFIPVLLMGDEPPRIKSDNAMVRVRAYREGEVRYALVVNNARTPSKVTVKVGCDCDDAREELGPKPKNTAPGVFEVEMPPMGIAMWKLGKKSK